MNLLDLIIRIFILIASDQIDFGSAILNGTIVGQNDFDFVAFIFIRARTDVPTFDPNNQKSWVPELDDSKSDAFYAPLGCAIILSPTFVLTTSNAIFTYHDLYFQNAFFYEYLFASAGSDHVLSKIMKDPEYFRKVNRQFEYKKGDLGIHLFLFGLKTDFTFNSYTGISNACLPKNERKGFNIEYLDLSTAGYGLDEVASRPSVRSFDNTLFNVENRPLRKIDVKIAYNIKRGESWFCMPDYTIREWEVCAWNPQGGPCDYDLGSPLLTMHKGFKVVIGISKINYGQKVDNNMFICDYGIPSVYHLLFDKTQTEWITRIVNDVCMIELSNPMTTTTLTPTTTLSTTTKDPRITISKLPTIKHGKTDTPTTRTNVISFVTDHTKESTKTFILNMSAILGLIIFAILVFIFLYFQMSRIHKHSESSAILKKEIKKKEIQREIRKELRKAKKSNIRVK